MIYGLSFHPNSLEENFLQGILNPTADIRNKVGWKVGEGKPAQIVALMRFCVNRFPNPVFYSNEEVYPLLFFIPVHDSSKMEYPVGRG